MRKLRQKGLSTPPFVYTLFLTKKDSKVSLFRSFQRRYGDLIPVSGKSIKQHI